MEETSTARPNAIFEGDKLSVSLSAPLSASLADPQSAKRAAVILINERFLGEKWTAEIEWQYSKEKS